MTDETNARVKVDTDNWFKLRAYCQKSGIPVTTVLNRVIAVLLKIISDKAKTGTTAGLDEILIALERKGRGSDE